jgi:hypothetical protein
MTSGQQSIIPDEREGVGGLRFSGPAGRMSRCVGGRNKEVDAAFNKDLRR